MKIWTTMSSIMRIICLMLTLLYCGCAMQGGPRFMRYRPKVATWGIQERQKQNANNSTATVQPKAGDSAAVLPGSSGYNSVGVGGIGGDKIQTPLRTMQREDRIAIYLRGIPQPEDIGDAIDELGEVNLPLIGNVKIGGLTTSEAETLIEKAYVDGGYYTKISVTIVTQDNEYFVRGEVKREGKYPVSGDLTLLQAIAAAGGYTDYAKRNEIKIIRGEKVMEFDAGRIEKLKDEDPLIKPSDIIVIPRRLIW